LVELVRDGTRTGDWLEGYGFSVELLWQIATRWPELLVAETRNLSNTPHGEFIAIGLRANVQKYFGTSQVVEPDKGLQEPLSNILSGEDLRTATWKPASPYMGRSRNDPRIVKGGVQRIRRPLVEMT
jgi:hypothetical protein